MTPDNFVLSQYLPTNTTEVIAAEEVFEFVSQLPPVHWTKTVNWMTRKLLEPDLQSMKEKLTEGS